MATLNRHDIVELKAFSNPPQHVIDVMGIVCMIIDDDNVSIYLRKYI